MQRLIFTSSSTVQAIALLEAIAPVNKLGSRDFTLWALY